MNRFARSVGRWRTARSWALLLGGALLSGCGQVEDGAALGGETHFLVRCGEDCGPGLSCIDGACTRRCEPGFSSCSELAAAAECVSAPSGERGAFSGTCDVRCSGDADCVPLGAGFACRSGVCRAELEDRQVALASARSKGAPLVRAVDVDTCVSGLRWVGGDRGHAEMRPGSDCLACHDEGSSRPLLLGGTVYPTAPVPLLRGNWPLDDCFGLEGIEVVIEDGDEFNGNLRQRSTVTNRAGNFYFEGRESDLRLPYRASIRWYLDGREQRTPMATVPAYGGCARCHSPVELYLDPSPDEEFEPDNVIPALTPIFPPGLYP